MNTENSKTNETNKFIYQFTDKPNLKNPDNKNIGLVNINLHITTINLKFLFPLGVTNLICLMDLIQFLTFKISLNLSSKNMKFWLKILPYKFTSIKSKTGLFLK